MIKITKEELNDLYTLKKLSIWDIAKSFNCKFTPIYGRLRKFGIPIRSISEAKKGKKRSEETKRKISEAAKLRTGKNHNQWKGGCQEYYNRTGRRVYIKNYGKIPDDYLIHHIDTNIKNNDISNLKMVTRLEHGRIHALLRRIISRAGP